MRQRLAVGGRELGVDRGEVGEQGAEGRGREWVGPAEEHLVRVTVRG